MNIIRASSPFPIPPSDRGLDLKNYKQSLIYSRRNQGNLACSHSFSYMNQFPLGSNQNSALKELLKYEDKKLHDFKSFGRPDYLRACRTRLTLHTELDTNACPSGYMKDDNNNPGETIERISQASELPENKYTLSQKRAEIDFFGQNPKTTSDEMGAECTNRMRDKPISTESVSSKIFTLADKLKIISG